MLRNIFLNTNYHEWTMNYHEFSNTDLTNLTDFFYHEFANLRISLFINTNYHELSLIRVR